MADSRPALPIPGSPTPQRRVKVRYGGLRAKNMGTLLGSLLVLLIVVSMISAQTLRSALVREFDSKGEAIAIAVAFTAERFIVEQRDASTIQGFVDRFRTLSAVGYVYVVDETGFVLSHTFTPEFPDGLQQQHLFPPGSTKAVDVKELSIETKGLFRDMVAPIQLGRLGAVHVGMAVSEIESTVDAAVRRLVLFALAVLFGTALVGFVITTRQARPIRELTQVAQRIAELNDLSRDLPNLGGMDEVGVLAVSFQALQVKLRGIIHTLRGSVGNLSQVVDTISTMTTDQNAMLSRQASSLAQTGTTATELQETSKLAAGKAGTVTEVALRAEAISQSGTQALEDTLGGLGEIQISVERVADRNAELSERTGQVAEITETVKDLADQSKVLALNAAIEATKAGEHGKGFAVVAREIRALATQSIESTVRVREILTEVEASIRGVVESSREGRDRVRTSVEQVRAGADNIRQLTGVVNENAGAAKQIAQAVAQQNVGISQIFTAVTDMNRMMSDSVVGLRQTNEAAQDLKRIATAVSEIVNSFRL